jgi:hypothetical protein
MEAARNSGVDGDFRLISFRIGNPADPMRRTHA